MSYLVVVKLRELQSTLCNNLTKRLKWILKNAGKKMFNKMCFYIILDVKNWLTRTGMLYILK